MVLQKQQILSAAKKHNIHMKQLDDDTSHLLRAEIYNRYSGGQRSDKIHWRWAWSVSLSESYTVGCPYSLRLPDWLDRVLPNDTSLITFNDIPLVYQIGTLQDFGKFWQSAWLPDFYMFNESLTYYLAYDSDHNIMYAEGDAYDWLHYFCAGQFQQLLGTQKPLTLLTINTKDFGQVIEIVLQDAASNHYICTLTDVIRIQWYPNSKSTPDHLAYPVEVIHKVNYKRQPPTRQMAFDRLILSFDGIYGCFLEVDFKTFEVQETTAD